MQVKAGHRKKPLDGREVERNEDDRELEDYTKVYKSITRQESSRLNNCERETCLWLFLIISLCAILLCR
jgi:hypothetical protein